jgi:phosphatidylglycerophosphate synthase
MAGNMREAAGETRPARKKAADCLTASRIVLALGMILAGLLGGGEAVGLVLLLLLVGWTTDIFDGRLARSLDPPVRSWIGDNDLSVDIVMELTACLYFVACGIIPAVWFLGYLLATAVAAGLVRTRRIVLILEMPILISLALIALTRFNWISIAYLAWLLAVLAYEWRRMRTIISLMLARDPG